MRRTIIFLLLILSPATAALAKTLLVTGDLSSRVRVTQKFTFSIDKPKDDFSYRLAVPASDTGKNSSQRIERLNLDVSPKPLKVTDETDRYGNRFRTFIWKNLKRDAAVTLSYDASLSSSLQPMTSASPFPLASVPADIKMYLQASEQVQSSDKAIKSKARQLTSGARGEYDAVTAIMRYVANQITYSYNPRQYDALYSLKTGNGNCQNYAHLALALLRASGIPGRAVGGYTLKEKWKVPAGSGTSIVYGGDQGGHAWLEVWFPDLGWLSYDPQQSQQFVSSRHIKESHGLQVNGITSSFHSSAPLPACNEQTSAEYLSDKVELAYSGEAGEPRRYVVSNLVRYKGRESGQADTEKVPKTPPVSAAKPKRPDPAQVKAPQKPDKLKIKPQPSGEIIFGNMQFPDSVALYNTVGNAGTPSFSRETAEYVTSSAIYAQAFSLEKSMTVKTVGLAMKKFGGNGVSYIDIVADDNGKPGMDGVRSMPRDLDRIDKSPGYAWVDFELVKENMPLKPGKYWIVLRHSGDAVMNWFYTPGKRYGGENDTRSTAMGWEWEDLLTYEFVFRLKGVIAKTSLP